MCSYHFHYENDFLDLELYRQNLDNFTMMPITDYHLESPLEDDNIFYYYNVIINYIKEEK